MFVSGHADVLSVAGDRARAAPSNSIQETYKKDNITDKWQWGMNPPPKGG